MLKVTVEVVPYGVGKPRELAVMTIANQGKSHSPGVSDYTVEYLGETMTGGELKLMGRVNMHDRTLPLPVLLQKATACLRRSLDDED